MTIVLVVYPAFVRAPDRPWCRTLLVGGASSRPGPPYHVGSSYLRVDLPLLALLTTAPHWRCLKPCSPGGERVPAADETTLARTDDLLATISPTMLGSPGPARAIGSGDCLDGDDRSTRCQHASSKTCWYAGPSTRCCAVRTRSSAGLQDGPTSIART